MNPELREAVQKLMKLASRMSVELYLGGSVLQIVKKHDIAISASDRAVLEEYDFDANVIDQAIGQLQRLMDLQDFAEYQAKLKSSLPAQIGGAA